MKSPENTESSWVAGPSIHPTDALLQWLESVGPKERVQLPVVIALAPLGITSARVAMDPTSEEGLALKLDDSRLGQPLASQLPAICGVEPSCAVWIEGSWGAHLGGLSAGSGPSLASQLNPGPVKHPFTVHRLVGPIASDDAPTVRQIQR